MSIAIGLRNQNGKPRSQPRGPFVSGNLYLRPALGLCAFRGRGSNTEICCVTSDVRWAWQNQCRSGLWSLTEGLCSDAPKAKPGDHALRNPAEAGTSDPREALDFIASHSKPAIFHLKDFHEPLRSSAEVRRRVRDLYQICLDRKKFIVITSAVRAIPEEVERIFAVIDLLPPDLTELIEFLRLETAQSSANGAHAETSEEILYQLARALQGLTLDDARHAVRRALASGKGLGLESMPALLEEKGILIKRSGVIDYVAESTGIGEIGGLESLKKWLLERRRAFQQRDQLSADIVPKGVLVMGIPGCGRVCRSGRSPRASSFRCTAST